MSELLSEADITEMVKQATSASHARDVLLLAAALRFERQARAETEALVKLAAENEREACAKVADEEAKAWCEPTPRPDGTPSFASPSDLDKAGAASRCATRIRARSTSVFGRTPRVLHQGPPQVVETCDHDQPFGVCCCEHNVRLTKPADCKFCGQRSR